MVRIFLDRDCIFGMVYLCIYYELRGLPHHNSDLFIRGESISGRNSSVWALYRSITLLYPNVARPDREIAVIH